MRPQSVSGEKLIDGGELSLDKLDLLGLFMLYGANMVFSGNPVLLEGGRRYLFGRVERRSEWTRSWVRLFGETGARMESANDIAT